MTRHRAYLDRETAISAAINTAIGTGFFLAVFHGRALVPLWGAQGVVVDCLPQGFMIGLMSSVVPNLLARRQIAAGAIEGRAGTIGQVLARGLTAAIAGMLGLTACAAAAAWVSGATSIGFTPGLVVKALAGGVLAAVVTRTVLQAMLGASRHDS